MTPMLDWHGVLSGQPLQWIISGFLTTVWVSVAGILLATLLAVLLLALRLGGGRAGRGLVAAWVSLFRNTPLLVQLLFWYFAAWNLLPLAVKEVVNDEHAWSILPGNVWWLTPEFLCSMWGLGVFTPNHAFKEKFGGNADNKYNNTFSSVTFSGGHEQDILGVLNGQFAGAVTWASMVGDYNTGYTTGAFNRLIRMDHPDLMKQIRIIWQSPLIPNGPILVSNALPADFKAKVVAAVKKLDTEDHACFIKAMGGTQHIGPGSVADFQQIIDMKRELVSAR
ncbi:ABC transporter permease subunit [Klebsiella pneumoniae]